MKMIFSKRKYGLLDIYVAKEQERAEKTAHKIQTKKQLKEKPVIMDLNKVNLNYNEARIYDEWQNIIDNPLGVGYNPDPEKTRRANIDYIKNNLQETNILIEYCHKTGYSFYNFIDFEMCVEKIRGKLHEKNIKKNKGL